MLEGFIERSGLLTLVLEDNLHVCNSSPSTSSSAAVRVAKNWIENCRQDLSAIDSRETCEVHGMVIKRMALLSSKFEQVRYFYSTNKHTASSIFEIQNSKFDEEVILV